MVNWRLMEKTRFLTKTLNPFYKKFVCQQLNSRSVSHVTHDIPAEGSLKFPPDLGRV